MERLPEVSWRVCMAVVRNGDIPLLSVLAKEVPIYMTDPRTDQQRCGVPFEPRRVRSVG
jgi:hypothetical protein